MLQVTPSRIEFQPSCVCLLFGRMCDFTDNKLLSYEGILKRLLLNEKKLENESGRDPSVKVITRSVVAHVQCIYGNASIASVGNYRCNKLIYDYHSKYMISLRNNESLNSSQEYKDKIKKKSKKTRKMLLIFVHVNVIHFKTIPALKLKRFPYLNKIF